MGFFIFLTLVRFFFFFYLCFISLYFIVCSRDTNPGNLYCFNIWCCKWGLFPVSRRFFLRSRYVRLFIDRSPMALPIDFADDLRELTCWLTFVLYQRRLLLFECSFCHHMYGLVPRCWLILSPTKKETSCSDQTQTYASHSKEKKFVRPTKSRRQQWPPLRTKICELPIFFHSGRAKDLSAPLYICIYGGCWRF